KVPVSSRSVPSPNGAAFLAPRLAAIAMGATIGRYRLNSITRPAATSNAKAPGGGVGFALKPYDTPRPSSAEPLFAEADGDWERIWDRPGAPGLLIAFRPQLTAANRPVGPRIMIGWTRSAIIASFISRAPIFLPRYSGVRPTIWPATKTPMIRNSSRLIIPTPLPP